MPNIRGKQICWWPLSWILKLSGRPVGHIEQSIIASAWRHGRAEWGQPRVPRIVDTEDGSLWRCCTTLCGHFIYTSWGPMWRLLLWAQTEARLGRTVLPHTGCGTGCDRPGQRGSSQCWCVVCGVGAKLQQFISSLFALAEFLRWIGPMNVRVMWCEYWIELFNFDIGVALEE